MDARTAVRSYFGLTITAGDACSGLSFTTMQAASLINQAIGVLVGRGRTLGEASDELDARAADAAHSQ